MGEPEVVTRLSGPARSSSFELEMLDDLTFAHVSRNRKIARRRSCCVVSSPPGGGIGTASLLERMMIISSNDTLVLAR